MTKKTTSERRLFSRIHFSVTGYLSFADKEYAVDVLDLSLKGALVRLKEDETLALGQDCQLRVHLGESEDVIYMNANIARADTAPPRLIGLACTDIDLDSITHLRRLVELNLGDSSLLHRELEHLVGV
ncbi:MAG: PilZ domain-containing protein [Zoogloeaceae bacterium]|nr:PilZ domain-containing protein [Zoogloeaceae bacterium]